MKVNNKQFLVVSGENFDSCKIIAKAGSEKTFKTWFLLHRSRKETKARLLALGYPIGEASILAGHPDFYEYYRIGSTFVCSVFSRFEDWLAYRDEMGK